MNTFPIFTLSNSTIQVYIWEYITEYILHTEKEVQN